MGPKCGATIWVKNTGTFGTSVNNGIGKCIQAKLVDQEGGGAVGRLLLSQAAMTVAATFLSINANGSWADLNPAAWSALTNSPDGQVAVEWCVDLDQRE